MSFGEAPNLVTNADVRISGVSVGKVKKISRFGQRTDAEVELQNRYAPDPARHAGGGAVQDAAGGGLRGALAGHRGPRKLADGGRLPARQVAPTQALDQVLSSFDESTRTALKRFLVELVGCDTGRGQDLSFALGNANPAVQNLNRVVDVLDEQQGDVSALVRETGTVLAALGRREGDLQSVVTAGNDVLSTTATRNRELTETVRVLPGFLRDLRGSLGQLERSGAGSAGRPHACGSSPRSCARASTAIDRSAPEFDALFRDLQPVTRAANRGLPAATSIFGESVPLFRVIHPASRELRPIIAYFREQRVDIGGSISKAAAATAGHHRAPGAAALPAHAAADHQREPGRPVAPGAQQPAQPLPAPGGLAEFRGGGLRAFDCAKRGTRRRCRRSAAPRPAGRRARGRSAAAPRVPARRARPALRDCSATSFYGRGSTKRHEDYGFFGPDSVTWRVWSYPTSLTVGFQRAVVVEELDPVLLACGRGDQRVRYPAADALRPHAPLLRDRRVRRLATAVKASERR